MAFGGLHDKLCSRAKTRLRKKKKINTIIITVERTRAEQIADYELNVQKKKNNNKIYLFTRVYFYRKRKKYARLVPYTDGEDYTT